MSPRGRECSVHEDEADLATPGWGGDLWNSLQPATQKPSHRGPERQDSRAGGLVKQGSRSGGLGRQQSRNGGLSRQDSRSGGLRRDDSRGGINDR